MNARKTMVRIMDGSPESKSITAFAVIALVWTSGMAANAAHPNPRRNPPATENPIVRVAKQPLDSAGRYFGTGWGDGYHGCHGSGFRPGADLPPKSSHAMRRRVTRYANTYYDRFDRFNLLRQSCQKDSAGTASSSCDQNVDCDQAGVWEEDFAIEEFDGESILAATQQPYIEPPIINKASMGEQYSLANRFEPQAKDQRSQKQSPVALPPVPVAMPALVARPSAPEAPAMSLALLLQMVGHPDPAMEPQLPAPRNSPTTVSSKPSRMPATDTKSDRVAKVVPTPDTLDRATNDPATSRLPQQMPTRLAELPQWALDATGTVQQNQFVR